MSTPRAFQPDSVGRRRDRIPGRVILAIGILDEAASHRPRPASIRETMPHRSLERAHQGRQDRAALPGKIAPDPTVAADARGASPPAGPRQQPDDRPTQPSHPSHGFPQGAGNSGVSRSCQTPSHRALHGVTSSSASHRMTGRPWMPPELLPIPKLRPQPSAPRGSFRLPPLEQAPWTASALAGGSAERLEKSVSLGSRQSFHSPPESPPAEPPAAIRTEGNSEPPWPERLRCGSELHRPPRSVPDPDCDQKSPRQAPPQGPPAILSAPRSKIRIVLNSSRTGRPTNGRVISRASAEPVEAAIRGAFSFRCRPRRSGDNAIGSNCAAEAERGLGVLMPTENIPDSTPEGGKLCADCGESLVGRKSPPMGMPCGAAVRTALRFDDARSSTTGPEAAATACGCSPSRCPAAAASPVPVGRTSPRTGR